MAEESTICSQQMVVSPITASDQTSPSLDPADLLQLDGNTSTPSMTARVKVGSLLAKYNSNLQHTNDRPHTRLTENMTTDCVSSTNNNISSDGACKSYIPCNSSTPQRSQVFSEDNLEPRVLIRSHSITKRAPAVTPTWSTSTNGQRTPANSEQQSGADNSISMPVQQSHTGDLPNDESSNNPKHYENGDELGNNSKNDSHEIVEQMAVNNNSFNTFHDEASHATGNSFIDSTASISNSNYISDALPDVCCEEQTDINLVNGNADNADQILRETGLASIVGRKTSLECNSNKHPDNTSNIFAVEGAKAKAVNEALFCLTCHENVTSPTHHADHETVAVSSAISNQSAECESLLEASTACLANAGALTEHVSHLEADLVKTRKCIAVALDEMFREIEHRMQERKMALITQLTDASCHKESYLADQRIYMDTVQQQLAAVVDDIGEVKKELHDSQLLAYHCQQLKESAQLLQSCTGRLNCFSLTENTDLEFDRHGFAEARRSLSSLASITSSHVIPSKCTASGDGLHKTHVQKQTMVRVTPRNSQGHIDRSKGLKFEAQLYNSEINVECQCINNNNGVYNVLYIAPEKGHYKLAVKLFNQHIKGSPYNIDVSVGSRVTFSKATHAAYELTRVQQHHTNSSRAAVHVSKHSIPRTVSPRSLSSAESFSSLKILPTSSNSHSTANAVQPPYGDYVAVIGQYGRKRGDFSNPQGVTMDNNNRIYCTDSSNQNIQVFTDTGSYINTVGKRGRLPGQLLRPIGLCYTKEGCLVFTDYENKCINVFKDGEFIRRIGQGKLIGPKGIAATPRGTVIVADNKGNQVLEFSINGRMIRKLQSVKTDKATQFAGPHYIAVNQQGDIFVSDFHNHCIKVFNKDGVFQRSFGQHGAGNGQFNAPTGLSIDQQGHVLVSDWGNSRIQVFDEEGSFLTHIDTSAAPLFGPQSIYAARDNKVVVADSGNHCVKIFKYELS